MLAFGAKVVTTDETFERIEQVLSRLDPARWYQASTIQRRNCYQSEGPKTIAYEITLQVGHSPDWLIVPLGGGGTLFGIWKGFNDLLAEGLVERVPRFLGVQAHAFNFLERIGISATIDEASCSHLVPDEKTATVCRNLKHGFPPDAYSAMRALHATEGKVVSVTDEDALAAQRRLAHEEGLFCEPSSAVVPVALRRALSEGWVRPEETVVGVITGSGLREPGVLSDLEPTRIAELSVSAIERLAPA